MTPMDRRTFLRRAGIVAAGSAVVGLGAGAAIPSLLDRFHRETAGASLEANVRLILRNAALAARIARAMA